MRLLTDDELTQGTREGKMPIPEAIFGKNECVIPDDVIITGEDLHKLWFDNGKCSRMKLKVLLGGNSHTETAEQFLRRRVQDIDKGWPNWVYETRRCHSPLAGGVDPKVVAQEFADCNIKNVLCKKYHVNGAVINRLLRLAELGLPNDGRSEQPL